MACRANESDLRDLVETDPDLDVAPFLRAASRVVARLITCAADRGVILADDDLAEIEALIGAHFYSTRDQRYKSKKTGDASATFVDGHSFWELAQMIDPSGCLKTFNKSQRVEVLWLGKAPSDQIDYVDRD